LKRLREVELIKVNLFMTDAKIIKLYFSRSEIAIAETDRKYGKSCRSLSYNIVKSFEDSEECVNSTYLKVWETVPPKKPESLKAYLFKIVRNISLNLYEKIHTQKRGRGEIDLVLEELSELIPSGSSVEKASDDNTIKAVLNYFLSNLSDEKRDIFVLRYFYLKSIKEIADDMSASEGKIKMTLKRLKDELKELLEKEGIEV